MKLLLTSIRDKIGRLLRKRDGPLTRELHLEPPQGAGRRVPAARSGESTARSVCGYCSTGCALDANVRDGEAVALGPAFSYPVNRGAACAKGWEALSVLDSPSRATTPLVRDRDGALVETSWDAALDAFCDGMRAVIAEHGRESVAFLGSGQITTEEVAFLGALARFGMGLRHGDGNTRQCMATAVAAYKECFGFDAPPYTYADLEASDCIVLVGANPAIAHPILWDRILRTKKSADLIVIDPRHTETAARADLHLSIRPKSDASLFYGLARSLIEAGNIDEPFVRDHTGGFPSFREFVAEFTEGRVAEETGVDIDRLRQLTQRVAKAKRASFWWTMGVNQSFQGVRTAQSIIAVALLTGSIGRPGTGANSITGQCNAMGSRLFSNTTNLLGGRAFADPTERARVAEVLGLDPACIPETSSLAYPDIIEGVRQGRIRALWIVGTNPAHSWIDQDDIRKLLKSLDLLVVQDMYRDTDTARLADIVLPAAGWGEKEGTFINSERRIGVVRELRQPPGKALADFHILQLIAERWGADEFSSRWTSPEAVFQLLKALSRGQPCDFSGIRDYADLDAHGGIQWPCPDNDRSETERRLFTDGRFFHDDGRARFVFEAPQSPPEPPDHQYPLTLLTGRGSVTEWHTRTRTACAPILANLDAGPLCVEMHPDDARTVGVETGDLVRVVSRRGGITATVRVSASTGRGQVFLPMHDHTTNRLTLAHFDPHSRQPSYKDCAVAIRPHVATSPDIEGRLT